MIIKKMCQLWVYCESEWIMRGFFETKEEAEKDPYLSSYKVSDSRFLLVDVIG